MARGMRVLDIDLDVFVNPVEHWADPRGRLDPNDHSVCAIDDALDWLRTHCRLGGPLPGWSVEHHVEIFDRWRGAITNGGLTESFHVTHLDAHADLGLGAAGYRHLLTDVIHRPLAARADPDRGDAGLNSGTFLAYAVGCRWITDIDYVYGAGGGSDAHPYLMEGFDPRCDTICLPVLSDSDVDALLSGIKPKPRAFEPPVPFRSTRIENFTAPAGYDVICLCRSPDYTPPTADPLYDAIRETFIAGNP
jgi:hypothetical protein